MTGLKTQTPVAVVIAALAFVLVSPPARAERRPPYGNDAALLEARVRADIERIIAPVLEQMAPGQAELKYVDVRVNRPNALPAGAAPGFEELSPATEFVAEKAEVALVVDTKLPAPFRKDLKTLLKNRLESVPVPVEIKETLIAFPTPRPQPASPREMPFMYPPMPAPAPQPAPAPTVITTPAPAPAAPVERGPSWGLVAALAFLGVLLGAVLVLLIVLLVGRRGRQRTEAEAPATASEGAGAAPRAGAAAGPAVDRLPEVRRALREDRVLARRVMGELLRDNDLEKVALTVELVGPSVVEDLRTDPQHAARLREAATLLDQARQATDQETRDLAALLHRRILKHRMVGADDPVEQEFAFLLGLSPERFASVIASEPPAVQAAALRYAPAHVRAAYLEERSPTERALLAAAVMSTKAPSRDHLMDVAVTLRARAGELAHLDTGEAGEIDLAVEMLEDRPSVEQAELLEAMRRSDPVKARRVAAALISDETFVLVPEDVLAAAAGAVPAETLVRFLRAAPESVVTRTLGALPPTVAAGVHEELSLDMAVSPQQTGDARRAVFGSLRRVLRDRGLPAPATQLKPDAGKVVAL